MTRPARTLMLLSSWMLLGMAQTTQAAIENRPHPACSYMEKASNMQSLASVVMTGRLASDTTLPVPENLARQQLLFKDLIDINHDGEREHVYVVQSPPPPPRPPEQEIIILAGSRFVTPFTVLPKGLDLRIYDRALREIHIKSAEEPTKALPEDDDVDAYRILLHRRSYYVVAIQDEAPLHALKIDRSNVAQPVCVFEQRESDTRTAVHALTTYEWLMRSFKLAASDGESLWEYAFSRDDFDVAELLLANGHSMDEKISKEPLLIWALDDERSDVAHWLLNHGANPNVTDSSGTTALQTAISDDSIDSSVTWKLLQRGADPAPAISDISAIASDEERSRKRSLILAAIGRLDYIPEQFLMDASEDPWLFDRFIASDLPVRLFGLSWHAGEPMKLPFDIDRRLQRGVSAREKAAIERLFERKPMPPASTFAISSYGSYTQGVEIYRYADSKLTDEHFLSFTTAFCHYFMPFDCGTEERVSRALAWAGSLQDECIASLRPVLNETACRLATHYRDLDRINAFTVSGDTIKWQVFLDTYRTKHGQ